MNISKTYIIKNIEIVCISAAIAFCLTAFYLYLDYVLYRDFYIYQEFLYFCFAIFILISLIVIKFKRLKIILAIAFAFVVQICGIYIISFFVQSNTLNFVTFGLGWLLIMFGWAYMFLPTLLLVVKSINLKIWLINLVAINLLVFGYNILTGSIHII